jgi:hypothetical protein
MMCSWPASGSASVPKPHPIAALVAGLLMALAGACACADEGGKFLYLPGP